MAKPITCKQEGSETVIRIPAGFDSRVLVAIEGPAGIWPSGWLVADDATDESRWALLNRLSASGASLAPHCLAKP